MPLVAIPMISYYSKTYVLVVYVTEALSPPPQASRFYIQHLQFQSR